MGGCFCLVIVAGSLGSRDGESFELLHSRRFLTTEDFADYSGEGRGQHHYCRAGRRSQAALRSGESQEQRKPQPGQHYPSSRTHRVVMTDEPVPFLLLLL